MPQSKIFDSAPFCNSCNACPVVLLDEGTQQIVITDPAKPEHGAVRMSVEQYNAILKNAKPVEG